MPTVAALDTALRDPNRFAPGIRRLGGGSLAVTAEGGLWRVVGATAAVYALKRPTGRILAIRVPLSDDAATDARAAARWRALATDPALAPLRGAEGALPGDIRYMPDAITLETAGFRSAGHPLVAMEYVPGGSLALAAERAAATRDRAALAGLARATTALLLAMDRAGFDHGHLRPSSILLREGGSPVLAGLDTATWPGAPRIPGVADHPGRDRLPALLLLTELLALADDPGRGAQSTPAPDRLLLSATDLREPLDSRLLAGLRAAHDRLLAAAATLLTEALTHGRAPAFAEAVGTIEAASRAHPADIAPTRSAPTSSIPGPPSAPAPPATAEGWGNPALPPAPSEPRSIPSLPTPPLHDIPTLDPAAAPSADPADRRRARLLDAARVAAASGNAALLLRLWATGDLGAYPPAQDLEPAVDQARAGHAALEALRDALDAGDANRVAAGWAEARDLPGAALLAPRVDAVLAKAIASRTEWAVRRGDARAMVEGVRDAQALGIALKPETRRAARQAAIAGAEKERFRNAAASGDLATVEQCARSGALDALGRPDRDLAAARDRALAMPLLARALASDDDAAILAGWNPALFAGDPAIDATNLARIDLARARTDWIGQARAAVRRRDGRAVRVLLEDAPPGALDRMGPVERRRIERLASAGDALARLETALRDGPDAEVLDALATMAATGAPLPEALDWAAVRGVVDRVSLHRALREAAQSDPPDYRRLARLLPAARAAMGAGLSGADDLDFARLERETLRAAALARLREALASGDPAVIRAAAHPDPFGALALLTDEERRAVQSAT